MAHMSYLVTPLLSQFPSSVSQFEAPQRELPQVELGEALLGAYSKVDVPQRRAPNAWYKHVLRQV